MIRTFGLKWERVLLIAFFGNYLINNVVAGIVSLIPASSGGGIFTAQYLTYVVLAAIVAGLVTWWYFFKAPAATLVNGSLFGASAFVISILTTFVSGIAGVLAQSGSLSQLAAVLPRFGPFLMSWATLVLLGFWVIPAGFVGWWLERKTARPGVSAPAAHGNVRQEGAPMGSRMQ